MYFDIARSIDVKATFIVQISFNKPRLFC